MTDNRSSAGSVDPADLWERYCAETPREGRSPQGAMAFAVDALTSDAAQSAQVRAETIEECARVCEARIKGNDGMEGGNDWGHNAPYNAEDKACAQAIRALAQPSPAATVETSPPGQVRADFLAYWNEHQACPEHSLTTENAAHACWQEAYKKYAPHNGLSAVSGDAWCQPMDNGKHAPRKFLLYFEDADRGIAVFDNEAEAREAFTKANTAWNCYLFGAMPLTAIEPQEVAVIERLKAKADEQTTALDQIMTTAADNLAAPNSDLKMTLEFIHHVAEYTLAVTRPVLGGEK